MIKAVIFDFDGVLVDSEKANIEAAVATFKELELPLSEVEIQSIPGRSSVDFIPLFLENRNIADSSVHRLVWEKNKDNYDKIWDEAVSLTPGVNQLISSLKENGKVLAIATTNRQVTVEKFFRKFGFRQSFSAIITGEDVTKRKPDPEVYLLVAQKLGVNTNEAIAVEDTEVGIKSAKAAGLKCIAVPNGYTKDDDFSEADYIASSIMEVSKFVQN